MVEKVTARTAKVVDAMLKENTGRALCDSGDIYGRHWERNQGRDFREEPYQQVEFHSSGEVDVRVSVYHWLLERVEFDPGLQNRYRRFCSGKENEDSCHLELMEKFVDREVARGAVAYMPDVVYTYNYGNPLSQDLQFRCWTTKGGDPKALVQSHNGCDARGGMSSPVAFSELETLMDFPDSSIHCRECGLVLRSDGSSWADDDSGDYCGYRWSYTHVPLPNDIQGLDAELPELVGKLSKRELDETRKLLSGEYGEEEGKQRFLSLARGRRLGRTIFTWRKMGSCPKCALAVLE